MAISSRSVWRDGIDGKAYPKLSGSRRADVAIIGGGITGIAAAYLLRDSGLSIVVLERDRLGSRGTGSTTAFLMEYLDTEASALIQRYGQNKARRIVQAHRDAIDWYESVMRQERIDCDFMRCSAYVYATNEEQAHGLREEFLALQILGTQCRFIERVDGIQSSGAIALDSQAKFHPLRFIHALAGLVAADIFERSEVLEVREERDGVHLHCADGEVVAQQVLMATHYPLDPQPPKLKFKKAWYDSYVIAAEIPRGVLPEALFEDMENPYHYIRVDRAESHDRIIAGGEDHRSDVPLDKEKAFAALDEFLKRFLRGAPYEATHRWYGRIVEPGDGIAYIGPIGRIFYATGYSGNGMTYGIIAARSFDAWCRKEPLPYPEYAASRSVKLREYLPKALEYIEEFFRGAIQNVLRR